MTDAEIVELALRRIGALIYQTNPELGEALDEVANEIVRLLLAHRPR